MSSIALKDLNSLPACESKNEDSGKGCFTKPCHGNMNENVEEKQRKKSSPIHVKGGEIVNYEVEVANSEVEYIGSENLSDLEDIDTSLISCLDLTLKIGFLLLKHSIMGDVITLVVKSLKNPRSAVCKTAIMTSAYAFTAFNDHVVDLLDPLLVQLLLKSSQDKKFVCEAAERALEAMTTWVSPNEKNIYMFITL